MTDEVATLVLRDNTAQTLALELAAQRAAYLLAGQQRLIQALEASGRLQRAGGGCRRMRNCSAGWPRARA